MTMATTTIRIDHATLPDQFDRRRPNAIAAAIEMPPRDAGIKAEASDIFSHNKVELLPRQLAAASAVLAELQLI